MTFARSLLATTAAMSLSACATIEYPAMPTENGTVHAAERMAMATKSGQAAEHDRLFAIFAAADEAELANNPVSALFRGDTRYAEQLGDYLTDEYQAQEELNTAEAMLALQTIDFDALSATDQLAYRVFEYNLSRAQAGYRPEILSVTQVRPVNHFRGFHTFYPTLASGQSAAPFATLEDYRNNLKRHRDYIAVTDRSITRMREGLDAGVLETKLTIRNSIEQLDTQLAMPIEDSPFMMPLGMMPESFSDTDTSSLRADYAAMTAEIYAAHARLRDFLRDEYLAMARESVGLSQMQGGPALYRYLIEETTTLPLDPDEIHALGLSEVARVKAGLEDVQAQVGFEGTLNEFFDYVRTDAQFKPESREALTQSYYDIGEQVDEKIGEYFSLLPETPLEIRPYEPFREKFSAGGSYNSGAPDGSRPGIFYFNAYDLPSRLTTGNMTLYLHEGAPGHHFQISLAQENEALPAFMRFGGTTAFIEGWALYAETLGYEMGFFEDPWNRYGTLQDEQLRAMRLVVDTGLHHKGWSRERAIDFMLENSGMTETEVVAEVERYIAIPSQALAYKIGALKIQELRQEAEEALGDRFDIRAFHAQVLNTGGLPLPVLEAKIDAWVASQ